VNPSAVKNCWIKSELIGRDDITSSSATATAASTDIDGDVSMDPVVASEDGSKAPDDDDDDDDDVAGRELVYELAKQFAKDNNDRQRTMDNMSDYDVMINELVVTMQSTPPEDMMEMMDGWINMEDNHYCRQLQREEAEEVMDNCDMLIDLQNVDNDADDAGGEVEDRPAPKVAACPDRVEAIAAQLKQLSIEIDGYEEDFGDLAQDLSDNAAKMVTKNRRIKAKKLEKKIAANAFRQPSVQPYFLLKQKAASASSAKGVADEPEPCYRRHENAYWLLGECKKEINDPSETPLEVAEAALGGIEEIRGNRRTVPSEDDDDECGGNDAYSVFFNAFSDLRSRSVNLIMTLSNNSDRLVDDTSLTREVLKITWENDFS